MEKVQGVLMTGISYISGLGYSTDIKVDSCRFLDDSARYPRENIPFYGLHENHPSDLFCQLVTDKEKIPILKELKSLFNGYLTKVHNDCIYPLYLVIEYVMKGEMPELEVPNFISTYNKTFGHPNTRKFIDSACKRNSRGHSQSKKLTVRNLIGLRENPSRDTERALFLLLEIGILGFAESCASEYLWKLKIPNNTMAKCFLDLLVSERCNPGPFDFKLMQECGKIICSLKNLHECEDEEGLQRQLKSLFCSMKKFCAGFGTGVATSQATETKYSENIFQCLLHATVCNAFPVIRTELPFKDKGKEGRGEN